VKRKVFTEKLAFELLRLGKLGIIKRLTVDYMNMYRLKRRTWPLLRSYWRKLRLRRNRRMVVMVLSVVGFVLLVGVVSAKIDGRSKIAPAAYTPLLNVIAEAESKGNYNAYFGDTANSDIRFTDMTIGQVLQWQAEYVRNGSYSSAVGRYQIVQSTLEGLVARLKLNVNTVKFDQKTQDMMAISLLERRGSQTFADQDMSPEQFAANLAQEWASLPKVMGENPDESYYASDGVNKSLVSIDEVLGALTVLSKP